MLPKSKSKVLVAFGVVMVSVLLAGCATFNPTGRAGMMGSSSRYYFPELTCAPPNDLPGRIIKVALGDMGMMAMMSGVAPLGVRMRLVTVPSHITSGEVSIVISNLGWRTHELVVLPLAQGERAGAQIPNSEGKIDEAGSLGEASKSCGEGSGEGIEAGTTAWLTLTLKPGRYEFVCNLQNHYADGMYQEVIVTS